MSPTEKLNDYDETTVDPVYHAPAKKLDDLYDDTTVDPVYHAKTRVLNTAIQDIGMGRYQYYLFVCAGFGWFADSVWPLISGLILTPVIAEFNFNGPFLSLAGNVGLLVGAIVWGLGSDVWGRKWSFNLTLLIAGVFGLSAGGSPNFLTLASLLAVVGVGVGGNMPVDSAVFLDLVPASHQYLLTVMSVWWSLGQLLISLLAWPLIANFSCSSSAPSCSKSDNMGWRYLLFILGALTLILSLIRFFAFNLLESPRFLVGIGNDQAAVNVIHQIAAFNSTTTSLSLEDLTTVDEKHTDEKGAVIRPVLSRTSIFTTTHVKALFATRKMAISTSLLIALWGIIGLASTLYNSFLPYLLASRGAQFNDGSLYLTYRNQVILSVIGVPGAFLAGWAVELPYIGRKGTLAISSGLTGAFLFASTTARSSVQLLGWNCGYVFFSNIMYGVLYAISPEIFPAKDRGTGNALVSTATRVFGVIAPVIALYANLSTAVPVYISGALIIFAGILALFLPFEPRGKASM
ncbi:MFS general substrate transporter [Mycena crocata]|nr:MFS general substrate transporter [Mycena crocata]